MDICLNTTKYICKSLVQYCINNCNLSVNDDDITSHECYCNCNSDSNYARICRYGTTGMKIVVILSLLLTLGGICLVCGVCRVKMYNYIKSKQASYQASQSESQLASSPTQHSISNQFVHLSLPPSILHLEEQQPPDYDPTPPPNYTGYNPTK